MESLSVHQKSALKRPCPARFNEIKVTFLIRPVDFVPDDGMPGKGGMDTDLMHPPGDRVAAKHGKTDAVRGWSFKAGFHLETGPRLLPLRMDHLFYPDGRGLDPAFSQEGAVHDKVVFLRPAPDDSVVKFAELPPFHRLAQVPGGGAVLRDEDDSAGLTVEPVDERKLPAADQFIGAEGLKSVEEGRGIPWNRWVHHEMRRLVHEEEILVFIHNRKVGRVKSQIDSGAG